MLANQVLIFKVRKILDIVTFNFDMEYNLGESISVDEAMIPFKGRLSFKQYMLYNSQTFYLMLP